MKQKNHRVAQVPRPPFPHNPSSPTQEVFADALRDHQAGRLMEAERLYRRVLAGNAKHTDSLNFLGVVYCQTGRAEQAVIAIRQAIEINPEEASYHSHLGIALNELGRPDEAVASYRRAIALKPDFLDAHNNLRAALNALRPVRAPAALNELYPRQPPRITTFLHVGCGQTLKKDTTAAFADPLWLELRLDINEAVKPHIVGNMTNMSAVEGESVDAVYSSHNIEHLYPHEVPQAFAEFLRVLKPDGFIVVSCPDLQSIAQLIADDKLADTAYVSAAGPIAPLDIVYGLRQQLALGNLYMAHHCGFTESSLRATLFKCGFSGVISCRHMAAAPYCNLWAVASKAAMSEVDMRILAAKHFPQPLGSSRPVG